MTTNMVMSTNIAMMSTTMSIITIMNTLTIMSTAMITLTPTTMSTAMITLTPTIICILTSTATSMTFSRSSIVWMHLTVLKTWRAGCLRLWRGQSRKHTESRSARFISMKSVQLTRLWMLSVRHSAWRIWESTAWWYRRFPKVMDSHAASTV